jgi:thioredoxin 1
MKHSQLEQHLIAGARPVIVDLWAPWCIPCRVTKPILESLANEYQGRVNFLAVNVDENPELAGELQIFSIPTVLVTQNGKIVQKFTGAQTRAAYRSLFEAVSSSREPVTLSISLFDRLLRLLAGISLAAVGLETETLFLIPLGGILVFLGVYDRCPLWRAITSFFHKRTP